MSVVIATPDNFRTIRKTISHLSRQTVRDLLQIVIVAPSKQDLELDATRMHGFHGYEIVELGSIDSIGAANAAGIRRATAPIVALAEDHCFPDPEWAAKLIEAHNRPWAAVAPCVRNANPGTAVSWADLLIGYGPWLSPTTAREMDFLPGHNSSYKRDVLLRYGEQLDAMMSAETLLHWDLRAKGHQLYLEPAASTAHTNFSRWSSWLPVQFYNGRLFAGERARGMSGLRRLVYTVGAPLIPLVRLARIGRAARHALVHHGHCVPAVVIGLAVDGIGQMFGYALGAGNALSKVACFEFKRIDHVISSDRMLFSQLAGETEPVAHSG
jgi:GT2 family glycosyltransferase